ncbi:hypothetical protein KI387_038619, partial [Taxus chinensis]
TLFIERSVYFDEIPMQASQEQYATTSVLPPPTDLKDDACNHADMILDSFESESDEHVHACVYPDPNPNPN